MNLKFELLGFPSPCTVNNFKLLAKRQAVYSLQGILFCPLFRLYGPAVIHSCRALAEQILSSEPPDPCLSINFELTPLLTSNHLLRTLTIPGHKNLGEILLRFLACFPLRLTSPLIP